MVKKIHLRPTLTTFLLLALPGVSFSETTVYSQLLRRAFQRSPEVRLAQAGLDQRSAESHTAWTYVLPQINLRASQTRGQDYSLLSSGTLPPALMAGASPEVANRSGWSLNASMPIYRRASHVQIQNASSGYNLAETELKIAQNEVESRLRSLYGDYLLASYKVAAVKGSLAVAYENERDAKSRSDLGQRTNVDLLRAQANVASLEARHLSYSDERNAAQSRLLDYLDWTPEEWKQIWKPNPTERDLIESIEAFTASDRWREPMAPYIGDFRSTTELTAAEEDALVQRLVATSPRYKKIQLEAELGNGQASAITQNEYPELSAEASLSKQAKNWDSATSKGNQSYSVGIVLNIPLSLGGRLISASHERAAAQQRVEIRKEQDVRRFLAEGRSQALRIRSLARSADAYALSEAQNTELHRLIQKNRELGRATLVEVLQIQNELMESKIHLAQSRIELVKAIYHLSPDLGVKQ